MFCRSTASSPTIILLSFTKSSLDNKPLEVSSAKAVIPAVISLGSYPSSNIVPAPILTLLAANTPIAYARLKTIRPLNADSFIWPVFASTTLLMVIRANQSRLMLKKRLRKQSRLLGD